MWLEDEYSGYTFTMRIQVRLFAMLRDAAKAGSFEVDLPDRSNVIEAFTHLAELHPAIAVYLPRVSAAVNREYVRSDHILADGDELALIPPVSGG